MGVLDVWLLLYVFSIQAYKTKRIYRAYTVQLKGNSNWIKWSLYIYFSEEYPYTLRLIRWL